MCPFTLQSEVILNYELTFRNTVPVHTTIKLCTHSYVTLRTVPAYFLEQHSYVTFRTVPAYFLEQFHEHYKSLLIMFVVTSTVLLYLVWSASLQCVFFLYGVQKCARNWITMSAGTQVALHGRNDLIHALTGKTLEFTVQNARWVPNLVWICSEQKTICTLLPFLCPQYTNTSKFRLHLHILKHIQLQHWLSNTL